jgi:hypothetical protein
MNQQNTPRRKPATLDEWQRQWQQHWSKLSSALPGMGDVIEL